MRWRPTIVAAMLLAGISAAIAVAVRMPPGSWREWLAMTARLIVGVTFVVPTDLRLRRHWQRRPIPRGPRQLGSAPIFREARTYDLPESLLA